MFAFWHSGQCRQQGGMEAFALGNTMHEVAFWTQHSKIKYWFWKLADRKYILKCLRIVLKTIKLSMF